MVTLKKVDVYELAYLAGGPPRCLDTAVVSLLEKGWLRVSRDGGLTVVETVSEHPVEAAVLAAVPGGADSWCTVHDVRATAWRSAALSRIADTLVTTGTLRRGHVAWPLAWSARACCTSRGQATVREQRAALATSRTALQSSALAVALEGPDGFADDELRRAAFAPQRATSGTPAQRRRRRGSNDGADGSGWASWGWASWGGDGGSGHGGHGGGCGSGGGSSCGGGGGCGGGGCGGS